MPGELNQIYANKTAINEKRKAIKDSGFIESTYYYWSSREDSSDREYSVDLRDGSVTRYYGKLDSQYVLGFLALEV